MNQLSSPLIVKKLIASPDLKAFLAGAAAVFGFAPFGLFPLTVVALAVLFGLWSRAERPAQAARLGFVFGMGLFCFGVGWIYVALHQYGNMNPVLAAIATALFAAVNACLPALAGYAQARFRVPAIARILLVMPAIWTLAEWLRGLLFTGFPWLSVGYSQAPASMLAGYAPVFGVYGVSLMVALSAGMLLLVWDKPRKTVIVAFALLWLGGAILRAEEWTEPHGDSLKVSLLQGNIPEDTKFSDDALVGTMETYRRLAQGSDARLIVMPETALPMVRADVPESYQTLLRNHMQQNGGDILIGVFEKENGHYYNSVYSLGVSPSQHYRKDHLVPFGEYIPMRSVLGWFINDVLNIPMGDQTSGGAHQPPLDVAGQKIAVDICYEDAFGEEIIRALPQATLLVNVTNDAWYGDSYAAAQHNQLSQMRALETGRMMLRATNTGVTSIIDTDGSIKAMLPQHQEGVLTAHVQGYVGSTPYVKWGNATMLVLVGAMLAVAMLGAAWRPRTVPTPVGRAQEE